jgi:hypothetical protein
LSPASPDSPRSPSRTSRCSPTPLSHEHEADHLEIKQRVAELVGYGNTHEEAALAKGISNASVESILADP